MRSEIKTVDPTGTLDAGGGGAYGFRVVPAGSNPGYFPIQFKLDREGAWHDYSDGAPVYLSQPFENLTISAPASSTWLVQILGSGERVGTAPATKRTAGVSVDSGVALPTAAPTGGADGYALQNNWRAIRVGVSGACTVTKYVRSLSGTWYAAGQWVLTAGSEVLEDESVIVNAGRIAYVSDTPAITADIDAQVEV